jgi:hypothetical protein
MPIDATVEVTLGMLGAALTKNKESPDENPRTSLFERIQSSIERRLDDPDLSPFTIARTHNISVRYVLFENIEIGTSRESQNRCAG